MINTDISLVYEVIDENFAKNHLDRRVALRNVSTKFESHLISYPASSSLIRDITIELRDDDDTSNWPILKRLAPQLERLEVHLMDRLWIEGLNIDEYELADNPNRTVSRISANSADVWRRVFDYSSVQFSNLTSITLITTSRIMEHLDGLKRCVPKIIDLTLVSHKCSELDDFVYTPNGLNTDYDNDSSFFDLKALTLSGDSNLCFAADEVVISADALSHLTFHFTDFPVMDTPELFASFLDLTFEEDMWDRMEDTRLVSFSMFGTRTVAFLQAFLEEFTTRKTHPAFWTLTDLYLGQDDLSGELDEESAGWCYPLLQGVSLFPLFPPICPKISKFQIERCADLLDLADSAQTSSCTAHHIPRIL